MKQNSNSEFLIRAIEPPDITTWREMRLHLYSGVSDSFNCTETEQIIQALDKTCFVLVADSGSVLAGFAEVSLRNVVDGCLTSPVGYLEGIYMRPEFRGSGHSRALLARAELWCLEQGCTEMGSDSELHNEDAQRFHEHLGFVETYRTVGFRKMIDRSPPSPQTTR